MQDQLRKLLSEGDFEALFNWMGWDYPERDEPVLVPDSRLRPRRVADKRGVVAWVVNCPTGLPQRSEQRRVVRRLKLLSRDQLIVFVAPDRHLWLWPEQRFSGARYRLVDHEYLAGQPNTALLQRLERASFTLAEEAGLTSSSVLSRVRRSFNSDKVTRSFYREFQKHHKCFVARVEGITRINEKRWYTSVLLNRLMFVYFIQQKGFLDGDQNYLRNRLQLVREHFGKNNFYAFYRRFLTPLFQEGLGSATNRYDSQVSQIIGHVPFVNGGIFEQHRLESQNHIDIHDKAFEELFDFFDQWRWHLDESPGGGASAQNEINPDILGFIFEQYINFTDKGQKERGAYYTKPDVTGYMATSSIIPAIVDRLVKSGLDDPALLLTDSGDIYIHDSIVHGVDERLPDAWAEDTDGPSEKLALPGERWCEVTHRRKRCAHLRSMLSDKTRTWTIDDAITENLDLQALLADYLTQLVTAEECDKAFDVLRSLTVCDPTVGSGAFLFAALEVLFPLYEEVLGRAAELRNRSGAVARCLEESERHSSQRYWTLKTICLNNLFGVDLMSEAPEIAKLRLFLKLAAQIDHVDDLEPLPDLDFNIKCGNLLVGIADKHDAVERLGKGRLDLGGEIGKIESLANQVARSYESFIEGQDSDQGGHDYSVAKRQLRAKLTEARTRADDLLWSLRNEQVPIDEWKQSHKPFHWFVEFPSAWRNGGFDVVIGNPPYIGKAAVKGYTWQGYGTEKCPNLYAVCVERAAELVNDSGRFAMIVMHNLCFSRLYKSLRDLLSKKSSAIWVSSYGRSPGGLFRGAAVRNSIALTKFSEKDCSVLTTRYLRWKSESQSSLFEKLEYSNPGQLLLTCGGVKQWPFIDDNTLVDAFGRLVSTQLPLSSALYGLGDFRVGYKTTALYYLGIYTTEPPTVDPVTRQPKRPKSNRTGWFAFRQPLQRDLALIILASRWVYLWWSVFSDAFDVTRTTLAAFPGDVERLCAIPGGLVADEPSTPDVERVQSLVSLSRTLQTEMPNHLSWKRHAGVDVGRYNMRKLRYLTDEADLLLAKLWGIEDAYEAAGNLRDRMTFGSKD